MIKNILLVFGFIFSLSLSAAKRTVNVRSNENPVSSVVNKFLAKIPVYDKYGWRGLTKKQQLKRAIDLGPLFNELNGGPDYLTILFARRYGKHGLF